MTSRPAVDYTAPPVPGRRRKQQQQPYLADMETRRLDLLWHEAMRYAHRRVQRGESVVVYSDGRSMFVRSIREPAPPEGECVAELQMVRKRIVITFAATPGASSR